MSISCFCSHCGARISAPDKAAGRKVKCPKCRAEFMVPVLQAKDSPLEVPHVEQDSPQVRHWSAPPPVRTTKVSEDDEIPTIVPAKRQPRSVRLAEDDEEEPTTAPVKPPAWQVAVGCSLCLAFLVSCCGGALFLGGLPSSPAREALDGNVDESKAITIARNFINARLKWDDEADFGSLWSGTDDTKAWKEGNVWIIQGHAKAKNGFGVKGRFFFQVRMVKEDPRADWAVDRNWTLLDIKIVD